VYCGKGSDGSVQCRRGGVLVYTLQEESVSKDETVAVAIGRNGVLYSGERGVPLECGSARHECGILSEHWPSFYSSVLFSTRLLRNNAYCLERSGAREAAIVNLPVECSSHTSTSLSLTSKHCSSKYCTVKN